MRSKIAEQILAEAPPESAIFARLYSDIVVRIHELMQDQQITQRDLASRLGKSPSEISKWLNGGHNLTLKSLAKLEAELNAPIIEIVTGVPVKKSAKYSRSIDN
jgi:transcriptional regulator with XRE-family HTH domain